MMLLLKYTFDFVRFAGVVVTAIGAHSLAGYVNGHERMYQWLSEDVGMAFNTSIAFVIVGISLFLIGNKLRTR